jgi:hypothetical protein
VTRLAALVAVLALSSAAAQRPAQVDVSQAPGPQNEASIAVDPANPSVPVAASQNFPACGVRVYGSTDGGSHWSSELLRLPDAARIEAAVGRRFCAGNEWVAIAGSARQYVAFVGRNPSDPATNGLSHSDDGGATWSEPARLNAIGGWGVQLAPAADGAVDAAWWGGPTLVLVRSTDGGATFPVVRRFASLLGFLDFGGGMVSAQPTEPVQPRPALGVDRSAGRFKGRVYAAYSRPTSDGRRIFVAAFGRDLRPVTTRVVAPARRGAFDEFVPSLAVDPTTGIVWTCFYLSGTGAARTLATFSCATSRDGGAHWTAPFAAASVASNETRPGAFSRGVSSEYASYEGLAAADGVAHPIWTDTRRLATLGEELYTTRLTAPR